ncbi:MULTISPECIES: hypothetical protein [Marinilabiliaceae]|uniref:Uncharacterized protein n=2 Tax=Marinilabiliaceae TaxID=558415 RepID=A0A1T5BXQ6_9BACT|nr:MULTISPECIES: hypothetical protein [Marinilabiliaceae]ASB49555.1 hypothetical protein CDL62_10590 [Alkalitalea saponilacus]TCO08015.1 hypothetical protein EV194_106157 [Natronoflexus pectinivorans]SKB51936.1 hypothetical protein SAMN03080601_00674 [Alkalitalea saponilacus]
MTKLSKILNIVLYVLLAVTIALAGLFYFGGEIEGAAYKTPVYTESILNWAIALVIFAAAISIIAEIIALVLRPKSAIRSLISIVGLAIIVLVAYSLGDATALVLPGYDGPDNVPSMLMLADTFLYSMYFLFGIAIAAILYTEVSRLFR